MMAKDNECLANVKRSKTRILISFLLLALVAILTIYRIAWQEPEFISVYEYVFLDRLSQKHRAARLDNEIALLVMKKSEILKKAGHECAMKKCFARNGVLNEETAVKLLSSNDVKTMRTLRQVDIDYLEARKKRMGWFVSSITLLAFLLFAVAISLL